MIENKWVFITGVYGSGKTTLAKQVSNESGYPLVGFDDLMDYSLKVCNCRKILDRLEKMDCFIMDAIPISLNFGLEGGEQATWEMFSDWEKKQNVQVICSYCPEEVWIGRIALRSKVDIHPISQTFRDKHIPTFKAFYSVNINVMKSFKDVIFWDSYAKQYTTREIMYERTRSK